MNLIIILRTIKSYRSLKHSHFFDAKWYKETYLKNSHKDPFFHFITHGNKVEFDPSPNFSTFEYFLANPDVKNAKMNAFLHYHLYGVFEGRKIIRFDRLLMRSSSVINKLSSKPSNTDSGALNSIKIFVTCKKDSYVPQNSLLVPIQTGAALSTTRFEKMSSDDTGDNISVRNESYAELTAQYWAWKNTDADYIGFFHNRRYLSFSTKEFIEKQNIGVVFEHLDSNAIEKLELIEKRMREVIQSNDLVVPKPFQFLDNDEFGINRTVRRQYEMSPDHDVNDLDKAISILLRLYPDYDQVCKEYLCSYEGYYMNIFIMRRDLFHSYCEWLFPILDELYSSIDTSSRSSYGKRVIGYVAERLFGIYLIKLEKENPNLRIKRLQNSFFTNVDRANQEEKKKDIKIFVSHRIDLDSETIDNPLYVPIRCGAFFDKRKNITMLGDDSGDNISDKRESYGELTVQYWAWKNIDADYYGLCHYRRYISFSESKPRKKDIFNCIDEPIIDQDFVKRHDLIEDRMRSIISQYNVISTLPMNVNDLENGLNVYESLERNRVVFTMASVDLFIEVVKELYPQFTKDISDYFYGQKWLGFNCFIMEREIFKDYSTKLFSILFEFEKRLDDSNFNKEQKRIIGYMGECFLAIYLGHLKETSNKTIKELPLIKVQHPAKRNYYYPAFSEKNIPIMITSSNEYVPFLDVMLYSILENTTNENNYDFIIMSDDISENNKSQLINTHSRQNVSLRFEDANSYLSETGFYTHSHLTPATYVRLAAIDAMRNYEKAIYLDCDMVITTDIAELFNTNLGDNYIAAVRDSIMVSWCNMPDHPQIKYNKEFLGLTTQFDYFNCGVLLLNIRKLREQFTTKQLFSFAVSENWQWFDQDILNIICQNKVLLLNQSWNVMVHPFKNEKGLTEYYSPKNFYESYLQAKHEPKIIHYAGHFLPCFEPNVDLNWYFWKYARLSNFYELILSMMNNRNNNVVKPTRQPNIFHRLANFLLPKGTRRRKLLRDVISIFRD